CVVTLSFGQDAVWIANPIDFSRFEFAENFVGFRKIWQMKVNVVSPEPDNQTREFSAEPIVLVGDIFVHGDENIEPPLCCGE
ncbi:MAG TPA: hypothetical protein VKZ53_15625, partial [Candidatus Angelobacter sp.]|nr:hypothetical protein [Candidatus Angelobacter sp.]